MVSDSIYELCLPVLQETDLEEDDRTEKLEQLLGKETTLVGQPLENAVLDVLWRFRESVSPKPSTPPIRHTIVRRPSPAPWQMPRAATPLGSSPAAGVSPAPPPGFGIAPSAFTRAKSSQASPFTSPRPSPRLAFSNLHIPHSPSLHAYEFNDSTPPPDIYGDYGSDNVDWLVNDDAISTTSSTGGAYSQDGSVASGVTPYMQPQQSDMSPYDMLRSVLGDGKTDEEIEKALEANGYDLSATIVALMEGQSADNPLLNISNVQDNTILVGKSMNAAPRPQTPPSNGRNGVVCRFWLSTGQCLRADCRYSHDLSNHICKYWMMGNCLAGDTCIFSHDPSTFMNRLTLDDSTNAVGGQQPPDFQLQDSAAFPSLQPNLAENWVPELHPGQSPRFQSLYAGTGPVVPPPGFNSYSTYPEAPFHRSGSRPTSRQHSRPSTPGIPAVDDTDAFPSLGSASIKAGKKHHGKRGGHGHGHKEIKEFVPNSLADVVKMSPSPGPGQNRKNGKAGKTSTTSRENSAAAQAIPPPHHVPWLETGEKANKAYLKARQEAIKHGGLRNKFLQSAAQAWNRNDARAAKALSLRGQSENELMRKAHREAARQLYEDRNKQGSSGDELYVDLHGLHPEEAVEYLEKVLLEQQASSKPIYAITGTGHHSKNGKDKVGKAIRAFLNEWRYAYREFSVPGDRNNVGGILGIDPKSYDKNAAAAGAPAKTNDTDEADVILKDNPASVQIKLAKEPPKGPSKRS